MDLNDFMSSNKVIKGKRDWQKSLALVKMAKRSTKFISTLKIDELSATIVFVNCYEALRQVVEAMSLEEGYKIFSHEAYTYYLKGKNEMSISEKFDRFRKLKNGANYYGKPIPKEVAENAKDEIKKIIQILKEKYLKDLQ